jgi:hypothetical protein
MKLYHYVPKDSDFVNEGILSVSQIPEETLKYSKRVGSDDPKVILDWLEKTFPGRIRSISVLTEPVCWQGNDPMLRKWVDQKRLIEIDFDELLKEGGVESVWLKNGSEANGKDEKIIRIQYDQIDFSPLPWHACSKEEGLFFGVIRHYFLVMKDGMIPPKYIKEITSS